MSKTIKVVLLTLYCIAIYLVLDITYSSLWFTNEERPLRIRNSEYSHTLAANFDGFDLWGETLYKVHTNNFGFKDVATRDIPLKSPNRRVLLIGDSFTEGVGLAFEDTFGGMLYYAGQASAKKIEFLNAAVESYSPTLYQAKIRSLLSRGLRFDEVVVFIDMNDIRAEAIQFFCFDSIPEYRARCGGLEQPFQNKKGFKMWLRKTFIMTDTLRLLIKLKWQVMFKNIDYVLNYSRFDGWAQPNWDPRDDFGELGIEGGITRARRHMQALAELLRQRGIALSVGVYPYAAQLNHNDRNSRQVDIWREFCVTNCKAFFNLFPAFFAAKEARPSDWYERYFIFGDIHYNAGGNRIMFNELAKHLL